MIKAENLKLISGTFSPEDASSILFGLIQYKINFHNLEIQQIRETGIGHAGKSEQRITELRHLQKEIQHIIEEAKHEKASLSIESIINIKMAK